MEFSPAAAPLAEKLLEPAREIIARYPAGRERSALLPLLHLVQTEEGYVSPDGVAFCAEMLGINKAQVGAVATFYTMYKRRPTGEYLVSVCTNTLCNVHGRPGGLRRGSSSTSASGTTRPPPTARSPSSTPSAWRPATTRPVMTVNYDFLSTRPTPEARGRAWSSSCAPASGRCPAAGARLCTLKEMSMQLAGFADDRATGAVADGPAGPPTLRGVTLAQQHGIAVAGFDPDTPIAKTKPSRARRPTARSPRPREKATGAVKAGGRSMADGRETAPATQAGRPRPGTSRTPGTHGRAAQPDRDTPAATTGRRTPAGDASRPATRRGIALNAHPAGTPSRPATALRNEEKK